jgi:Ca2+-binding EF-hand superfamily protein
MSIAGVGSTGTASLSQMLSSLLSRVGATSSNATTKSDDTASNSATSGSDTSLTGSSKPSLSSMILGTLIGMQQQQSGCDASQTGDPSDAVQNLFTAMDSDGDGTVSQTELEGYIEQQGGTQNEADSLYSMLDPSGGSGISESTLAGDAPQGPPPGGPPPGGMSGPHHGGMHGAHSASDVANSLLQSMDSDSDGSVSQSEFESFVTSNGGTKAQADADFSALDTSNSGSLSTSDFEKAIEQQQQNDSTGDSDSGAAPSLLAFLDKLAGNGTTGSTLSVSA